MHAGTEQLLTIRDGGPVDAAIAEHAAACDTCQERLAQMTLLRDRMRALADIEPPAEGWSRLAATLERPAASSRWRVAGIAAAAAVAAVVVWRVSDNPPPQSPQAAQVETAPGLPAGAPAPAVDTLLVQSRQLERLLRQLDTRTPRVMNASTAGTIAGLQDGIAVIDFGLSNAERLSNTESQKLWRQRVDLMNTLVQVRGAQLQQATYRQEF